MLNKNTQIHCRHLTHRETLTATFRSETTPEPRQGLVCLKIRAICKAYEGTRLTVYGPLIASSQAWLCSACLGGGDALVQLVAHHVDPTQASCIFLDAALAAPREFGSDIYNRSGAFKPCRRSSANEAETQSPNYNTRRSRKHTNKGN